jgi:hypothetical protein
MSEDFVDAAYHCAGAGSEHVKVSRKKFTSEIVDQYSATPFLVFEILKS